MPDKRKPIKFQYPIKGVDENWAYSQQPQGSTPAALNVRPFDMYEQRLRGGQRSGHSKYFADVVNGINMIQQLDSVAVVFDPRAIVADTTLVTEVFTGFSDEDEIVPNSGGTWEEWIHTDPNWVKITSSYDLHADDDEYSVMCARQEISQIYMNLMRYVPALSLGTSYIVKVTLYPPRGSAVGNQQGIFGIQVRMDKTALDAGNNTAVGTQVGFVASESSGTETVTVKYEDDNAWINGGGISLGTVPITFDELATCELRVSGNYFEFYWNDGLVGSWTTTANSDKTEIGVILRSGLSGGEWSPYITQVEIITGKSLVTFRIPRVVAVSGGNIYAGTFTDGLSLMTNGSGVLRATDQVATQEAYQKSYFCDGYSSGYRVLTHLSRVVANWEATAGSLPVDSTGTTYAITTINQGTPSFTVAEDLSELVDGDYIKVAGSTDAGNDGIYLVASVSGSGPTTITVDQAIPVAAPAAKGTLAAAEIGCRIMCLYRGRIVLAGIHSDPHNWYMSAVGDPLDWDYSPDPISATMAVAGSNTDAGKMGDIITALIPYSDDMLIMGGDHTIWILRGDPADGGIIDNLSYQTGIVGSEAFAWDPEGNLYFFGANALWKLGRNASSLDNLSFNRLERTFGAIDLSTHHVRLVWDNLHRGLHIYFTQNIEPSTAPEHYFWDQRTDSFWPDQFPTAQGPTAVHVFDADDPTDRAVLLGGFDSYIRRIDSDETDDDGTVISSYVDFAPVVAAGDLANTRLTEITPILASDSDSLTLKVYAEESAEAVLISTTPRFTRTLQAGRNSSIRNRVNGNAIRIRLQNESASTRSWALESMTGLIALTGKTRKGRL